jgi:predicted peptidase
LVFLHGAYEKGFDNEQQLLIGGKFFLRDSIRKRYPAYILFPQCPESDLWAYFELMPVASQNNSGIDPAFPSAVSPSRIRIVFPYLEMPTGVSGVLIKLIDSLIKVDHIDRHRIYIAGLSQGGMGVLDLIARYPDFFAAGLSICGAGNVTRSRKFAGKTSLWLFHGTIDNIVPVTFSRDYYKSLQKLHADVRYSEYAGVRHDCWKNAFREPDFMSWLFSRHKN